MSCGPCGYMPELLRVGLKGLLAGMKVAWLKDCVEPGIRPPMIGPMSPSEIGCGASCWVDSRLL